MLLPKFEYLGPTTLDEAFSLLSRHGEAAKVMAGGTDLLVKMKDRLLAPRYVVGIKGIADLDYIRYDEAGGLRIGGSTTLGTLARSPIIAQRFGCLHEAVLSMATPQIRNMGTIGGNLCSAAPSADSAPPLVALGAKVRLTSSRGTRECALEDFFVGPGKTLLAADELLCEVQVPPRSLHSGAVYLKLSQRSAVDIAAVCVAVALSVGNGGACHDVRIVLGAVAPTPMRARRAEAAIEGKALEAGLLGEAASLAMEEARPISDVRSSADYRKRMVGVLTKRGLTRAHDQARSAR